MIYLICFALIHAGWNIGCLLIMLAEISNKKIQNNNYGSECAQNNTKRSDCMKDHREHALNFEDLTIVVNLLAVWFYAWFDRTHM